MIAMIKGDRQTTGNERRELEKQKQLDKLSFKVWQHEPRIEPQVLRELKIILDRLEVIRTEEVQEACNRYGNNWL